jgi:hypothetical protein
MSTLGVNGAPISHNTNNIVGGGVSMPAGHQAPVAVSHSILTKDESLEQYATLKKDQTPPIMQSLPSKNGASNQPNLVSGNGAHH